MSKIKELENFPEINFIDNLTAEELLQNIISDFKNFMLTETGTAPDLPDGDPMRLLIYAFAAWQYQAFKYLDTAAKSAFLRYSEGAYLDNLGALRGIARKGASHAKTTIKFTLSDIRASASGIAGGTRVSCGSIGFLTDEYFEIPAGQQTGTVTATAEEAGRAANGIKIGDLKEMTTVPQWVSTAENITETSGGTDIESDEDLTLRIYQAPAGYSVAGAKEAYIFHARNAVSDIGDIIVDSPQAGAVDVYFTTKDGALPSTEKLEEVKEYLSASTIRPLTDMVEVKAPTEKTYNIKLTYYICKSDKLKAVEIQNAVDAAILEFETWQRKIGRAITPSKLIQLIMDAGAKRVALTSPTYTGIGAAQIPKLGTKAITYGGIEDDNS